MTAGERLRLWRNKNNITASEMAKKIGITTSGLTSFERNEAAISHRYLTELSMIYGISIDWLLTGSYQNLPENENELLQIYRILDKSQSKQLIRIAQTFLPENEG